MKRTKYTEEQFKNAVKNNDSIAGVLKELGLSPFGGGSYYKVKKYVKKLELDTTHWMGQSHNKGKRYILKTRKSLEEILVKDSAYTSSHHLRNRLFQENILEEKCKLCGLENRWNNKKLSLQLDHINGVHDDNRIENLRILCPNCHSQTENFTGKNIGK